MARTLLLLVVLVGLVAGCGDDGPAPVVLPGATFTFNSGGQGHIGGHGAWGVIATRAGTFAVTHFVRGEDPVTYPTVALSAEQRDPLWSAIDGANLAGIEVASRPGVPDEVRLTFGLSPDGGESVQLLIWQNDVSAHAGLGAILDQLRTLIEAHHGVAPVF